MNKLWQTFTTGTGIGSGGSSPDPSCVSKEAEELDDADISSEDVSTSSEDNSPCGTDRHIYRTNE